MRRMTCALWPSVLLAGLLLALLPACARAEVIEEIVARVNDDIITRTELQQTERETVEEIYSKGAEGEAADKQLARAKNELLRDLITKRILIQQAERLYDLPKMEDSYVRQFKEQQKITTNSDLESLLKADGLTLAEFRRKLVEINAPSSVIDLEVRSKISVSDGEIDKFYKDHSHELASAETVSFREIVLLSADRPKEETLDLARSLVARARGGAGFADLARQSSSVDAGVRGVLLGPFKKGELASGLEALVFSMKPGEVSEPIELDQAFHIVRLEAREESSTPPLETIKDKISNTIERQKFDRELQAYFEKLWLESQICVQDEYMQKLPAEFRKYVKCS